MLLAIDVGNTNIKLGVFGKDGTCEKLWRMSTGQRRTADEAGTFIYSLFKLCGYNPEELDAAIISSVVPDIMYSLTRGIKAYFNVESIVVNHSMKMDINFKRGSIREVGADRLVNCVAARAEYDGAVIIVDYGTAIKYDVLAKDGEFITGITAPGIEISADALFQKAALIGKVELAIPKSIIVGNTTESIQAGLLYGKIGEAEYIIKKLKKESGLTEALVVATGGLARVVSPGTDVFDVVDPFLTLKGLKVLYDSNK